MKEFKTKVSGVTGKDPISGRPRQQIIHEFVCRGMSLIAEVNQWPSGGQFAVKLIAEVKDRPNGRVRRYHIGDMGGDDTQSAWISWELDQGTEVEVTVLDITGGTEEEPTLGVEVRFRFEPASGQQPSGPGRYDRYQA